MAAWWASRETARYRASAHAALGPAASEIDFSALPSSIDGKELEILPDPAARTVEVRVTAQNPDAAMHGALAAAEAVLVPLQCEYFALEGISELTATLRRIQRALNPGLAIEGVLLTMVDERTNLTQQVMAEIRNHFKDQVFRTMISRSVRLGEAPSFGKPMLLYDIRSKGSEAYLELAKELMANE